MKKKNVKKYALLAVVIAVIGAIISYNYYIDQTKIRGFAFGNEIQQIQDELKELQGNYYARVTAWEEGDYTREKLLSYSEKHVSKMEDLLARYDDLDPPEPYESSVELFRLSTNSQYKSDRQLALWLESQEPRWHHPRMACTFSSPATGNLG